ncbi:MAG: glycosyltransferase [Sulfuricurvum sp.]|uniref:glycosyltransferase family 2 protein n=1 Tax=Sulfuricurvum sp. TaxID=2025608 RepID=UPI0027339FB0|nr:glycosyltransferase [Sulfuricurvum sp.]MDP2851221.1 glycosyltransferase [Sulfuricurvum sp.]
MEPTLTPLISIIIPLYNGERFIAQTLESVLAQTYRNIEVIVVDDASTDGGCDIVRRYGADDSRVNLILSETNFGGPARPRNIGIENAKGEFIAFVDADDVWKPHKLQTQLDFLIDNPDIDMLYSPAEIIDEYGEISPSRKQRFLSLLLRLMSPKNAIIYGNFININTLMLRQPLTSRFIEDSRLVAIEDWMFHILNLQDGMTAASVEEALIYYRVHSASISNRHSDKSYRKIFYMLSLLFLETRISFGHFCLANILNSAKLLRRKLANAWSSH